MKKALTLILFLVSLVATAQDVSVKLTPFVLETPNVVSLKVRPIGAIIEQVNPADSTQAEYYQQVYYELVRADGRPAETGNMMIPEQFADLLRKYKKKQVSAMDMLVINAYLAGFNSNMVALTPE